MKNYLKRFTTMLRSSTGRLALTYLAIIMIMSIGFSIVFYEVSSRELGRQLPPNSAFNNPQFQQPTDFGDGGSPRTVNRFLRDRIDEGRDLLLTRLIIVNVVTLAAGGLVSYLLARRTLQPIEAAMQAQTQFISDASHELRTPLAAIRASNEVALRKPKLSLSEAKKLIEQNTADVARLTDLSDGLLSLAAQDGQAIMLSPVSLQDISSDALNQIIPAASEKDITVEDSVPDIKVPAERVALSRVIVILLDNAIKYSPEKSSIKLTASKRGKFAYLKVIDHGMGIRASDVPYLFRRFYRADAARSQRGQVGYGLGLSIAEKIVVQHNGEVSVTSKLGEGSIFTIKLPLAD